MPNVAEAFSNNRRTVSTYRADLNRDEDPDDSDLIIVEEDGPEHLASLRPAPLVRRQEYRQLFAKLRRG
jgi:hypothetical protein